MKQNKYFALIVLSMLLTLASCNDYEKFPVEITDITYVFDKGDSLGYRSYQYLADIYRQMYNGHNRFGVYATSNQTNYLESATDNAISATISDGTDIMRLATGNYSASFQISEEMSTIWATTYKVVRKTNVFIANIDVVPLSAKFTNDLGETYPLNRAWKAEARFLRALFYFELVKRFGGIPLMGDAISELGDDLELPRNSFAECIDYIVDELDAIKDSLRVLPLPDPGTTSFVVTKTAALALKSRVLLYAASPLFNGNSIESGNELIGYTTIDDESIKKRWEKASQAAKDFIDNHGGDIGDLNAVHTLSADFLDVFISDYSVSNKEIIFVRQGGSGTDVEKTSGPVGFSDQNAIGQGMTCPTQDLVDAFLTSDGRTWSGSLGSAMYQNRDKRLDYTILHNGSLWLNTNLATYEGGIHNPQGAVKKTKTSYYMRKFMQKAETETSYKDAKHRWIMFRYAEILLNFAEAENEAVGPTTEVYKVLSDIRKRAGIAPGRDLSYGLTANMTQEAMREVIRNDRRIELAFEEHRFWDIRRWRIAEEIYKKPLQGLSISRDGSMYSYNRINVLSVKFEPKMNLYPIPYSEVNKNRNMKQNPGWW